MSRVDPIGGRLHVAQAGGARYQENQDAALAYLLKAASPDAGKALDLERYGEAGRIIGKRCGRTQNVGEKTRRRACQQALSRRSASAESDGDTFLSTGTLRGGQEFLE